MASLIYLSLALISLGLTSASTNPKSIPKVIRFPKLQLSHSAKNNHSRVFGGTVARDGQFPYMVLVLISMKSGVSRCSAALISEDLVLLAAHCFPLGADTRAMDVIAVAGRGNMEEYTKARYSLAGWEQDVPEWKLNGVQERRGDEVILNKHYRTDTFVHDLALLRVSRPFALSHYVQTLPISAEPLPDVPCIIAGWGLTESSVPSYKLVFANHVRARSVSDGCQYKLEGDFYCLTKGSSGICQGDSGSPLVCENQIWGVASHYLSHSTSSECGDDEEEYYVDLSKNIKFLKEAIDASKRPPVTDPEEGSPGKGTELRSGLLKFAVILVLLHLWNNFA